MVDEVTSKSAPDSPTGFSRTAWGKVLKRTGQEFLKDNLGDWAAALTYYAMLSIFPGLLVLVAVLGLLGQSTTDQLINNLLAAAPGPVQEILTDAIAGLQQSRGAAGVLVVVGLAGALWSASGYIGAFMRASNAIYDVPEGRPIWKTIPIRLAITATVGVLLVLSALIVTLSGRLATFIGDLLNAGEGARTAWSILKWPLLLLLVSLMISLLYWASPNAKQAGFRWITPGGLLAVALWILASVGFGIYATNFGSYNKTYGTLGGIIIFLVWLWITNLAILFGAELNAELHRGRAIAQGQSEDDEPYVELRDTPKGDETKEQGL